MEIQKIIIATAIIPRHAVCPFVRIVYILITFYVFSFKKRPHRPVSRPESFMNLERVSSFCEG